MGLGKMIPYSRLVRYANFNSSLNSSFWRKFQFLTKFGFFTKFEFLTKISSFDLISIFHQILVFAENFNFSSNYSFCRKFQFFTNFDFWFTTPVIWELKFYLLNSFCYLFSKYQVMIFLKIIYTIRIFPYIWSQVGTD